MARDIILHEFIDVVGQGQWAYMEHTKAQGLDARVGFELLGTFYTMGITGRWPQCVNMWDCGGWDGWRERVDRLNLKRKSNADLDQWWDTAFQLRTGGFDRALASHPASPSCRDAFDGKISGSLFVHELTEVRPGTADDYLGAIADQLVPVLADYGIAPMGLYEVLHTDYEVCVVWATDVDGYQRMNMALDAARGFDVDAEADPRLLEWRSTARQWTTRWREELMTPAPGTPVGPPEWELDPSAGG